jgi:rSAM/selenodomain-associated transferase 1
VTRPPAQLLVLAKAPVPGRVKTRLSPPYTPTQAGRLAAAALRDTLDTVARTAAERRVLVVDGACAPPRGFAVVPQRDVGLGARLAAAFADTAEAGLGSLLVGMDTPQITAELLDDVRARLHNADAVLGPAVDGGWWCLALRDPTVASVLAAVPMSTPHTARFTIRALQAVGVRVQTAPVLRDVDTAEDAQAVARAIPGSWFARELSVISDRERAAV